MSDLDKQMWEVVKGNPHKMIPWYLMAGYAYYERDSPILSDAAFDQLSKDILKRWDELDHRHKDYITTEMLEAGTLFGTDNLPTIVSSAASRLIVDLDPVLKSRRNRAMKRQREEDERLLKPTPEPEPEPVEQGGLAKFFT